MHISGFRPPARTMGSPVVAMNKQSMKSQSSNAMTTQQNQFINQKLMNLQLQAQPFLGSNINFKG